MRTIRECLDELIRLNEDDDYRSRYQKRIVRDFELDANAYEILKRLRGAGEKKMAADQEGIFAAMKKGEATIKQAKRFVEIAAKWKDVVADGNPRSQEQKTALDTLRVAEIWVDKFESDSDARFARKYSPTTGNTDARRREIELGEPTGGGRAGPRMKGRRSGRPLKFG